MITGLVLNRTEDIIIFNPIRKFSDVGLKYDTKNKAHKKLSINVIKEVLVGHKYEKFFNELPKKDDIADAIYMAYITKDSTLMKQFISLINW